mmetsp:Transcript_8056/g.16804  ORF Transcript_8056/g.16804 Transcript_8056/m.16804 type:complete len:93 (+) Transcript_8056:79-357(+)
MIHKLPHILILIITQDKATFIAIHSATLHRVRNSLDQSRHPRKVKSESSSLLIQSKASISCLQNRLIKLIQDEIKLHNHDSGSCRPPAGCLQ